MEENTPISTINPSEIPVQSQPIPPSSAPNHKNFPPSILGVLALVLIVGSGSYYLGTQQSVNSKNDILPTSTPTPQVTPEPTVAEQPSPSVIPTSNVSQPTQTPPTSTKTVVIPSNWKPFTATDSEYGVKTSMSMPLGYSFGFSGSEFTIQNDSDSTELWDYSTSIYRNNDSVLNNHYDGSSRRAWYAKYLIEKQSADKIVSVKEHSLNSSTYLEITVQAPSYDDPGVPNATKSGTHYIFVQNNILHMITPASIKSYTSNAQIPRNIEPILESLTSAHIK